MIGTRFASILILPGLALASLLASPAWAYQAREIAAGGHTACAIVDDGEVWCWGGNKDAVLGGSNIPHSGVTWKILRENGARLSGMRGVSIAQTAEGSGHDGGMHACAVSALNEVWCWGRRSDGRLGSGDDDDVEAWAAERVTWADQSPLNDAVQVAAGGAHTCAVRSNGHVHCWGRNEIGGLPGLLGQNRAHTTAFEKHPLGDGPVRRVNGHPLENVRQVVLGRAHACALSVPADADAGSIWCWGMANHGQTGSGVSGNGRAYVYAVQVQTSASAVVNDAVQIAAGVDHSCAVLLDERVLCWGANHKGQAGQASTGGTHPQTSHWAQPVRVDSNLLLTNVGSITAGHLHTCVRTKASSLRRPDVKCWGDNSHGVIGINVAIGDWTPRPVSIPQASADLPGSPYFLGVGQLAAGQNHMCALHRSQHTVRCWGRNHKAQLGDGGDGDALPHPVPHPDLTVYGIDGLPLDHLFRNGFD